LRYLNEHRGRGSSPDLCGRGRRLKCLRQALEFALPWRDAMTHLVMSPLELMQRLAALVPRPGLHPIRFHDALAPNAKLRAQVVRAAEQGEGAARPDSDPDEAHDPRRRASRINSARRLKRVLEIDIEHCPNCGGEPKLIAAILQTALIERILEHLGLPARAPPLSPARAPMSQAA
jgi:hypothetical protein